MIMMQRYHFVHQILYGVLHQVHGEVSSHLLCHRTTTNAVAHAAIAGRGRCSAARHSRWWHARRSGRDWISREARAGQAREGGRAEGGAALGQRAAPRLEKEAPPRAESDSESSDDDVPPMELQNQRPGRCQARERGLDVGDERALGEVQADGRVDHVAARRALRRAHQLERGVVQAWSAWRSNRMTKGRVPVSLTHRSQVRIPLVPPRV